MSDPVAGGIGKASEQMMQELQKQMESAPGVSGPQGPQFDAVLASQQVQEVSPILDATKVPEATQAADVLRAAQAQEVAGVDSSLGVKPVEAAADTKESGFKKILDQVVDGQNKLDDIIQMATSGKTYGSQELLAIQAAVYKFSAELELTSKVVEKATSGVKQTMQTQV